MNALSKLINVIISAGAINGFFIALILTTNRNSKRKSNRILAALLIVLSVSIVHSVFFAGNIDIPYRIKEPFILLVGPLLLFYFRECTGMQSLKRLDVLHFAPFVLFFGVSLSILTFSQSLGMNEFLIKYWSFSPLQCGLLV